MNIVEKLKELKEYYKNTRKVGHTSLVREGIKNYSDPKFVMGYKKSDSRFLQCDKNEVISWVGLNKDTLRGFKRPLVIDNSVMDMLVTDSLTKIEELEDENKRLKDAIKILTV